MSSFDESEAFQAASLSARAMAPRAAAYMEGLNPAQRAAVEAVEGPVLMLAGAGTGKTRALTARIAHLLATGTARPNEILAVTFTNKAAREMKTRVGALLGQPAEGMPWLGTFHAICVKLLRRHAELAGLKSNFTILDTDDQVRLMKQLILAENIDEKRWPARVLAGVIDNWKNRAWTPEKVPAGEAGAFNKRGVELYAAYQARLKALNAVDFGDLLLHVVTIFQENADVLAQYQRWFRYILVDEYQDTNVAQYLWLRLLAQSHRNICCVGDDDQSIYGWRGAEVGNILRFEKDFPGAKVVRLEQNYRSTEHILDAANHLIQGNKERLGKELETKTGTSTVAEADERAVHKVRLIGHWDGEEEARWVGEKIEDLQSGRAEEARKRFNTRFKSFQEMLDFRAKHGLGPIGKQQFIKDAFESGKAFSDFKTYNLLRELLKDDPRASNMLGAMEDYAERKYSLNEIAILVRASHQMRAFEDRFLTIGLPYRVIGGPRFYERMEIRDAMAYFRLAVSPTDDLAMERVINVPRRGVGPAAMQKIYDRANEKSVSLTASVRSLVHDGKIATMGGKARTKVPELVDQIFRWHELTRDHDCSHVELAEMILEESGYIESYFQPRTEEEIERGDPPTYKDVEAPGRLENLKELVKALESFENLQGFLEHVSLIMDNESDDQEPKVTLMTLHAAKGLEFPAVFLPGWEDGLFPSQRSMDESGLKGLEEERRLAYVGITRAEEVCTISFAGNRRVYGQWQSQMPSRFIDELPEEHVEVLTPPGLYGHGGAMSASASPVAGMMRGSDLHQKAAEANVYNSPGWRRLQANQGQRGMSQPREARNMTIDTEAISAFLLGDRVFHQKFGYGRVNAVEGDKVEVAFDKAGIKHVVGRFLTAADSAGDVPF
ncbi:ATP-dependent helicase [Rhodophyticola porphyridii]|uniref:DNA 3'-5' helicase n=1 Tax=Rhodophyticola porphyridii TaxID=1852017 RepID=A0A3L9Y3V5_9RHOB|nr:UvrD-helicase domain-containing protein [Rhodophyticola porphyridii]RMA43102.1 DNA helicase II [Rhodophyticola porphyridii]